VLVAEALVAEALVAETFKDVSAARQRSVSTVLKSTFGAQVPRLEDDQARINEGQPALSWVGGDMEAAGFSL
jgi:hypothetical protein